MGSGGAASESIFFIGAIILATALVGVFSAVSHDLGNGVRVRGDTLAKQFRTDITIVNDPAAVPDNPMVIYVKNTGTSFLYAQETTVIRNGVVVTVNAWDVLESTDDQTWKPGQVLRIQVNGNMAAGDYRVRVVTDNGVEDTIEFSAT